MSEGGSSSAQQSFTDSQKLIEQLQKMQEEANQSIDKNTSTSFNQVMQTQQSGQVNQTQKVDATHQVLKAALDKVNTTVPSSTAIGQSQHMATQKLAKVLDGMSNTGDKLQKAMQFVLKNPNVTPQQLLVLQMQVSSWSNEVSVTTKTVQEAGSSMQTLNNLNL
jgi:phenylalanyl-tRNA synthetase alpha subunit